MQRMDDAGKMSTAELRRLATNVARLSAMLTRDRQSLPAAYLKDPELRDAYVRYFLPANVKKVHRALTDLSLHPDWLLSSGRLRVLDLGTGPGTSLLGVLSFFSDRPQRPSLTCVAVDRVAENLRTAEDLFTSYKNSAAVDATLKTIRADIEGAEQLAEEPFDYVIFSNVLNELFPLREGRTAKRAGLVQGILGRLLAEKGSCIIIEPALRTTSRDLLEVRDVLLTRGFHVYAPCLTEKNCPALASARDWCHEDIPWDPPALIKEIDRLTGLRKDSLKFSYLVLGKQKRSLTDLFGPEAFRVVSEPLITKGKIEFYICGAGGRKLVTRLDKDRTPANQCFDLLKRGAIAGFERLADEGTRFRVERETGVVIHKNAA